MWIFKQRRIFDLLSNLLVHTVHKISNSETRLIVVSKEYATKILAPIAENIFFRVDLVWMLIILIFNWPAPATSVVLIGKTCLHNMVYLLEKYYETVLNKGKTIGRKKF